MHVAICGIIYSDSSECKYLSQQSLRPYQQVKIAPKLGRSLSVETPCFALKAGCLGQKGEKTPSQLPALPSFAAGLAVQGSLWEPL